MGLRQSKRSVDITASPKKDAAAAEKTVAEEVVVVADVKSQDEQKTPVEAPAAQNGDAKPTETAELVILLKYYLKYY